MLREEIDGALIISIHAPAKGATKTARSVVRKKTISIHAPAKGATSDGGISYQTPKISIHAPAKGATSVMLKVIFTTYISIHAPAKGATRVAAILQTWYKKFQSTLPRRERREIHTCGRQKIQISIHAPAKGATHASRKPHCVIVHFNPRSREGSDGEITPEQ